MIQYEEDDPLNKALDIANDIVENTAATSNSFTRQLFWNMQGETHPYASHIAESKFYHWAGKNADANEGIESFKQKRPARFPLKNSVLPNFFETEEVNKEK